MTKVVKEAWTESGIEYTRVFSWKDNPSAGFGFPCDADGNVNKHMALCALQNYASCLDGTFNVTDNGIEAREWRIRHPSIIECEECSSHVTLANFTNTCDCGADYNMSGARLAPRHQWGEETGEHWSDCY